MEIKELMKELIEVLIVAKCIVNKSIILIFPTIVKVLIVAKCIVNFNILYSSLVSK